MNPETVTRIERINDALRMIGLGLVLGVVLWLIVPVADRIFDPTVASVRTSNPLRHG